MSKLVKPFLAVVGVSVLGWSPSARACKDDLKAVFGGDTETVNTVAAIREKIAGNNFETSRSFREYIDRLTWAFETIIEALKPTNRWLDIGAGNGNAISRAIWAVWKSSSEKMPEIVAINAAAPSSNTLDELAKEFPRLSHKIGYLEDLDATALGTFDLISDVQAGGSYTFRFSEYYNQIGKLLAPNGLYMANFVSPTFLAPDGTILSFEEFLSRYVRGLKNEGVWGKTVLTAHLRRTSEEFFFPKLKLIKAESTGGVPLRTFQVVE